MSAAISLLQSGRNPDPDFTQYLSERTESFMKRYSFRAARHDVRVFSKLCWDYRWANKNRRKYWHAGWLWWYTNRVLNTNCDPRCKRKSPSQQPEILIEDSTEVRVVSQSDRRHHRVHVQASSKLYPRDLLKE